MNKQMQKMANFIKFMIVNNQCQISSFTYIFFPIKKKKIVYEDKI